MSLAEGTVIPAGRRSLGARLAGRLAPAALVASAVLLASGPAAAPVAGQEPDPGRGQAADSTAAAGTLRVFFDCNGPYCDFDFYRREIPFVNYTRDREDAQVHLLVTSEQTGSGGRRFTLDYIGREDFVGLDDRVEVATRANLASEQVMSRVSSSMKLGLLRYVARTSQAPAIQVYYEAGAEGEEGAGVATPETDPWNFWTFRVRANANLEADERTQFYRLSAGVSANRVTEALKLEFSLGGSYNESEFELEDSTTVTSIRRNFNANALTAWSLSDHWSVGARARVEHSTFSNEDLALLIAPALEYNIFPYAESTRRQFSFLYAIGVNYFKYIEETVFLKTEETVPIHSLTASLSVRQPWGGSFGFVEFTQFLDDPGRNRLEVFGGVDLRLFRGLSLNFNASASRVRDQINLPAGEASDEEILLRQRELATGFEYEFSVGFSYTFGSIFSNVVNPRLERF